MITRKLILTADESTWPQDNVKPILFLGEWCKLYHRKDVWKKFDSKIVPYHWDDRQKLFRDYKYLQKLYEKLLFDLSNKLNHIHSVDYSLRYWRILVGPWLCLFIEVLFDRWYMLKYAIEKNKISDCYILERDAMSLVPNDIKHFTNIHVEDDWNEAISGQLIDFCWNDKVNIKKIRKLSNNLNKKKPNLGLGVIIKNNIAKSWVPFFNSLFPRNDGYFFISSYLPLKTDFKLQISLGQFPKLWQRLPSPICKPDTDQRAWQLNQNNDDIFESIARRFIPSHIPTTYLEGYEDLIKTINKKGWPKKPKVIFTSNAYNSNDVFKAWTAAKTEKGTMFVIGQHGGQYGMMPFSTLEKHQIEISDKWLSWGWSENSEKKIIPVGNFKNHDRKVKFDPIGKALMVLTTIPRYSSHLNASPLSSQWIDYFVDQQRFIKELPSKIKKSLFLRLYPHDYGWDQKDRWKEIISESQIDLGRKNIRKLIKKSRIYISTYNATTFLESLYWNVPSIIFWNSGHWELKDETKPYFELLKSVGIFHDTPESAAQQMINIWDDILLWWNSKEVQNARLKFCKQYSRDNSELIRHLKKIFIK